MTRRVRQTTIGTSAITTAARDSVHKIRYGVTMIHQDTAHFLRYYSLFFALLSIVTVINVFLNMELVVVHVLPMPCQSVY
jgi:hypothetical protein